MRAVVAGAFGRDAEALLVERLRAHPDTLVLVATVDGEIAGCIVFSRVEAPASLRPVRVAGLAPLAIGPWWQGQGIGTLLMQRGLDACAARGFEAVVVLGHPGYYARFGFRPAHAHGVACRWVVPEDAFMVRALAPGALDALRGRVDYLPEFDEV